ncbi:hypothetical protein SAMN05421755_104116 [Nitrosomonas sp. Nm33]|nr:hypothetical protein SAMN05421755_104116 [Nitrosomonas sp. Nm33]
MQCCIVHVGMHKTGGSSIQRTLFRELRDSRFRYLDLGHENHNGPLATAFLAAPEKYHLNRKLGLDAAAVQGERQRLRQQLDRELQSDAEIGIISGEDISGLLSPGEVSDLHSTISKHVCDVVAVGYVRPPFGFMESLFQQVVKSSEARDFDVGRYYPQYLKRFRKFDQIFGRKNVLLWPFSSRDFPGGCVVRDFSKRVGATIPESDIHRVNEAIPREALSLLFIYRKFGPGYGIGPNVVRENNNLIMALMRIGGPKLRLSSSLIKPVIEQNAADLAWMEERLGVSLDEGDRADDDDAIRNEGDLLQVKPDTLRWLSEQLEGSDVRSLPSPRDFYAIAQLVHQLRDKVNKVHGTSIKRN